MCVTATDKPDTSESPKSGVCEQTAFAEAGLVRIAVFGGGAWGTALAVAFARVHEVTLWARDTAAVQAMEAERSNRRYLPGVAFPDRLRVSADFTETARGAGLHLVVTPLAGLRATLRALRELVPGTPLIWACKGLEAETGRLPHEIVRAELGTDAACGVLTGPSFAAEVGAGMPTAVTLASADRAFAEHWLQVLHQPRFRIYSNTDLVGAEVGGGLKNVIAIASGVSDGMGFGLNARAALITRGLAEITRLGVALGARPETLMGLTGMGDLILTCTGDLSRNRRVGLALAEGKSLPTILAELGHVAEGVPTARAALRLASTKGVEMPITEAIDALLHSDGIGPRDAVELLLSREPRHE
ncbi:NAD(P)H-dependent glycerol-3-phosphate dehydrogenase [Azoarcus taiwanensis]|uniref:Glycerol-3-phosphate dehydrogenase [NAD(P)+] n=1 Tax=Azoarcus taiwanensis TaxID=666964 RepID=A0A972F6U0_9RHOO|nr:NAD(P)H-dependent glycerol-3-phosphate dehydrogenase [Azoarcus taiwanensis]